jgi:hypothetical protein
MKAQCLATAWWLYIRGKALSLWVRAQKLHWRADRRAEKPISYGQWDFWDLTVSEPHV